MSGFTAAAFYRERLRTGRIRPLELGRALAVMADSKLLGGDPSRLGDIAVAGLRGDPREALEELGRRLFSRQLAATIRPEGRELLRAHRRRGHTVALATSATHFQVDPIARDLGVDHVLCSEVEVDDGVLTGSFSDRMLWGEAKARAARALARERGLALRSSYAYANGDEDIPLLSAVGHPYAVNPDSRLERAARSEGWPIVRLPTAGRPGVRELVGTAGAAGGMNLAFALGAAIGIVQGDRRAGANFACSLGFDVALALGGVHLDVHGEEHLWARRPAVFVFNHQSNLDPIVVGALLRRDFTATGKKEARWDPAGALIGRLLDAVYLDRENPAAAKQRMGELVDRLRGGESVMIAPEGTRTPTQIPRPFKHGAFHVARQARVPVVPIVLRNTGDLWPRGAKTIRPGVVQVSVLAPIGTSRWRQADVGRRADDVREQVVATLERWPSQPT